VPGLVVSLGTVGGAAVGSGTRDGALVGALIDGGGRTELELGMAGNGGTAVWVLVALFASISAMTSPTTNSTATLATTHSQRGDDGPSGGGETGPSGGGPPDGDWSCSQCGGKRLVGSASLKLDGVDVQGGGGEVHGGVGGVGGV
jgi:hypothetical protein